MKLIEMAVTTGSVAVFPTSANYINTSKMKDEKDEEYEEDEDDEDEEDK